LLRIFQALKLVLCVIVIVVDLKDNELKDILCLFNQVSAATEGLPDATLPLESFNQLIEGEFVFVAKINEEIAGFASFFEPDRFIHHLYVSQKYQYNGIGKFLLNECENRYGRPLYLKCNEANTKACAFYDHIGWTKIGKGMGPDGPDVNYSLPDA